MDRNLAALLPDLSEVEVNMIGMAVSWKYWGERSNGRTKYPEWKAVWERHEIMLWGAKEAHAALRYARWSYDVGDGVTREAEATLTKRLRQYIRGG